MPGLGLGLQMVQRPQLQLEQRLQLQLVQRMHFLPEEEEYHQQQLALEKMREDLDNDVYSSVAEFSDRIMKRIKKPQRTQAVENLVGSIRLFIDSAEQHGKELSLTTLHQLVELGLSEVQDMNYAHHAFEQVRTLAEHLPHSLDKIIQTGKDFRDERYAAQDFYRELFLLEEKTNGEFSVSESYESLDNILQKYPQQRKVITRLLHQATQPDSHLNRKKTELFLRLTSENCELAVSGDDTYQNLSLLPLLKVEKMEETIGKYSRMPLPILAEALAQHLPDTEMERLHQFAGSKDMRNSRDNKRAYLSAMITIRTRSEPGVIADILRKAEGMKQARDILAKFAGLCKLNLGHYNFGLPDGKAIIDYLDHKREFKNPVLNELSVEAQEKFCTMINRNLPSRYDYLPLLKLGEIYADDHKSGIPLLGKMMESMIFDRFEEFRYTGSEAYEQLACLQGATEEWRKNVTQRRIVGDLEGVTPIYKAVLNIVEQLEHNFTEVYQREPTPELLRELSEEKSKLIETMSHSQRTVQFVPQDLLQGIDTINEKIRYAFLINQLHKLTVEELPTMAGTIAMSLIDYSHPQFSSDIRELVRIANTSEVQAIRPISIRDTDEPNYMFDVGCTPQKSCQRWTEKTGHNDCLPAYVVDANKRLVQALDERNRVRVRSIVRLMEVQEIENTPTLFVEDPYADLVSDELYTALLGRVVEKAYQMSTELCREIAVAARDKDMKRLLKGMADKSELDYDETTFTTTFPLSRNGVEYSDSFGGRVLSGTTVSCHQVGYFIIDAENDE